MIGNKFDRCMFLGNLFTQDMIERYSKYASLSIGNDNYEKNFLLVLKGIFSNVEVFSAPPVPRFSHKFPFLNIKKGFEIINNCPTMFVPFINGRFLYTKQCNIKKSVFNYIKKNSISCVFLSTYHYSWIIKPLKRRFPNVKIFMLLPDLPSISVNSSSFFNTLYMKNVSRIFDKYINMVDCLLPITPFQIDMIPNFNGNCYVYESYFDAKEFDDIPNKRNKAVLYAGSLNTEYGIENLINSFLSADLPEYDLLICGKGNYSKQIEQLSQQHKNIKFLGFLSKEDTRRLEKQSSLIVCPDIVKRKYSFHSRYLEYLSSCTPILTYKPLGAKGEYFEFFNYIEDYSSFSKALEDILNSKNYSQAENKAKKAREFMLTKKSQEMFSKLLSDKIEKVLQS